MPIHPSNFTQKYYFDFDAARDYGNNSLIKWYKETPNISIDFYKKCHCGSVSLII